MTVYAFGLLISIIAGLLGNVVTNALALLHIVDLPVILDPILVGVALSYVTVEIVSRKSTVSDKEHALRERLHQVPESEIDPVKLRRTLLWPKILIASGVFLFILMMVFYVAPYREATAGSATGEILMSLGVGLSMVVGGALAWWGTARSYRVT